jgi:hypothetical protein
MEVKLEYKVTQDLRDTVLLESLVGYFNCGGITRRPTAIDFRVTRFSDLVDIILPFFDKYNIEGVKAKRLYGFQISCRNCKTKRAFNC